MPRKRCCLAALAGAAVLTASVGLTTPAAGEIVPAGDGAAEDRAGESCRTLDSPVRVLGQDVTMSGTLCTPRGNARTVMVLVPGSTYNQTYWDFPYKPQTYSFRSAMNSAGYATLTVDRLGTGGSSKPLSATVTASVQANAVHQVIQRLRNGSSGAGSFDKVVIGGHSLGSTITNIEAATYRDVDGVLLTGFTNNYNLPGLTNFFASLYPAALDARLGKRGLDTGYLTTRPGARKSAFYAPGPVEPGVLATDERTKDVLSLGEGTDGVTLGTLTTISRKINAPTMIANGQRDAVYCGTLGELGRISCQDARSLARDEDPYFGPAARLRMFVLPGSGHNINLVPNAPDYHAAVVRWLNDEVGAR